MYRRRTSSRAARFLALICATALGIAPRPASGAAPAVNSAPPVVGVATVAPVPPEAAPAALAPTVTASKSDGVPTGTKVSPGDTITYTVTIAASGEAAGDVVFSDTIDPNTTLVPGSIRTTPVARPDAYQTIGNVDISVPAAQGVLSNDSDPDGDTLTASGSGSSANAGTFSVSSDGGFTYTPPRGFEGSDSFAYTLTDSTGKTGTGAVTVSVSGMIWFVDNASAAAAEDGRRSTPYKSLASFNSVNVGTGNNPADGDVVFLHSGSGTYTGGLATRAGQRVIGQGASDTLANLDGINVTPSGASLLPGTGGTRPTITNAGGHGLQLRTGMVVRGLTVGNTSQAGIFGNGFGTVTVGNASLPDVEVANAQAGGGPALDLTGGTLSASRLLSVSSSGAGGAGIVISGVAGSLAIDQTTVGGPAANAITVTGSSLAVSFNGTTSVAKPSTGGTAVALTNNTGTASFQTLQITGGSAAGPVNVQGLLIASGGAVNVTGPNAFVSVVGGQAVSASSTAIGMTFSSLSSTNSAAEGIHVSAVTGSLTSGATTVTNPATFGIRGHSSGASLSFGTTSVAGSGGTGVSLGADGSGTGNTGATSFGDLDVSPDAGQRGIRAVGNTGTIASTSGDVVTVNATAVEIAGPSAANRTPLSVTLTKVSATAAGGAPPSGIVLTNTNGPGASVGFVVNGDGANTAQGGNASGGTIANTAGAEGAAPTAGVGVRLEAADEVVLRRMQLNDHPNFAIFGTNVSNFTLEYSTVSGANGNNSAFEEGSVHLWELTGSALINACQLGGGHEFIVDVRNYNGGSLDRLTVSNSLVGDLDGAGPGFGLHASAGDDALLFNGIGNNATFKVSVINNVINAGRGDMVNFNVGVVGNNPINSDFVLRGNTLHNQQPVILSGGGGVTVTMGGGATLNSTYEISCNSFRGARGTGLLVAKGSGSGTAQGTIFNNRFGVDGVPGSSSIEASGINVDTRGAGTHTVLIKNNVVNEWGGNGAIQIFNNQGSATMNATVVGNTSNNPHPTNALAGLYAEVGALSGDTSVLNLKVGGTAAERNNFVEGDPFNGNDVLLSRIVGAGTVLNFSRGVSASSTPSQIVSDNNVTPVTTGAAGSIAVVSSSPALPPAINEACSIPAKAAAAAVPESALVWGSPPAAGAGFPVLPRVPETVRGGRPLVTLATTSARRQGGDGRSSISLAAPAPADRPAARQAGTGKSGETVTRSIGTLPAGATVTITFQVTVSSPFAGASCLVTNQATVTGTGFPVVLTDDPDVAGNQATVTPVATPITISSQPSDQTGLACGGTAQFAVAASASGTALTYQWRRGTTNLVDSPGRIGGAQTATLTISALAINDVGSDYNVVVSNSCDSKTSNNATLAGPSGPSFTAQPAALSNVAFSDPVTLTASAASVNGAVSLQWLKGGSPLADGGRVSGATTSTLTISGALGSDAGTYVLRATDSCGFADSSSAVVQIVNDPESFDSPFDVDSSGWEQDTPSSSGTWALETIPSPAPPGLADPGPGGYFTSSGATNYHWSTISRPGKLGDYEYEVRFARTGACASCSSALWVRAVPTPFASANRWATGYMFAITKDGRYSVYRANGSAAAVALQPWTASPAILQGDGKVNRLRVIAQGSLLRFVINGQEVVVTNTDSLFPYGRVGIGIARSATSTGDVLRVDSARLNTVGMLGPLKNEAEYDERHPAGYRPLTRAQERLNRRARRAYARQPYGTPEQAPELEQRGERP